MSCKQFVSTEGKISCHPNVSMAAEARLSRLTLRISKNTGVLVSMATNTALLSRPENRTSARRLTEPFAFLSTHSSWSQARLGASLFIDFLVRKNYNSARYHLLSGEVPPEADTTHRWSLPAGRQVVRSLVPCLSKSVAIGHKQQSR